MYLYLAVIKAADGSWLNEPIALLSQYDAIFYINAMDPDEKENWVLYECRELDLAAMRSRY